MFEGSVRLQLSDANVLYGLEDGGDSSTVALLETSLECLRGTCCGVT